MSLSSFNYVDYVYLTSLFLFMVFFSIKGATRSINYSLKIILSISLPFIFYKRSLNFFLENLNSQYLNDLANENSIFLEIIIFVCLFLLVYLIYSLIEKAINIKSPSQLEFKIIDVVLGGLYGLFLFSILFYLSYSLILKNHIKGKNIIYIYNISFYENLLNKEEDKNKLDKPSKNNKENDQKKTLLKLKKSVVYLEYQILKTHLL